LREYNINNIFLIKYILDDLIESIIDEYEKRHKNRMEKDRHQRSKELHKELNVMLEKNFIS
jgi:hypothetical protein